MSSKKFGKILGLSLVGCFCLAGCDDIQAKPTDYDDKIVSIMGYDEEIYNNVMNVIYDALHDGSLASDVLDEVLYQYAISVFGRYNKVTNPDSSSTTLKEAVADATNHIEKGASASVANEFIKGHKAYWTVDNDDNRLNDDDPTNPVVVDEDADACESEYIRLISKWDTIEDRISETMMTAVRGGSYSTRDIFYEKEYLQSLYTSYNKVANPNNVETELTHTLVDPDIEEEEVFDEIDGIEGTPLLHRELYQSNYALDASESVNDDYTYVEDVIIPNIYRDLLVEQYILDETYNSLGRSYARKVNVVAIPESSDYKTSTWYLMHYFLDNVINAEPEGDDHDVVTSTNHVELSTFKTLARAYRGIDIEEETDEYTYLTESEGFSTIEATYGEESYVGYLGTPYGELVEKISKLDDNIYQTDESVETEFNGGGTYPISTGIELSENSIRLQSYTYDGWFIKNGGLSNLPDSIRTRLFNISVANAIQEGDDDGVREHDRWQYEDGEWVYSTENDVNNYVAIINGRYYLKDSSVLSGHEDEDVLFYEDGTYYIIEIEEAISSSKLSKTSNNRYAVTRGSDVMEDAVNEIAKLVATSSSYDSLSTEYWLEQGELTYHDQAVYDYFYENYPDLFDD
ncbi:MAG: hypothetical protein LUC31_00665 [Coprobacillus sp.]|nr:hypothetical protein [Coprobacillus sp.]